MNSLYKRIITLGMVSVTALLAWVYCMITFPKQLVYLGAISLVVVISLYALLNALTGLQIEKENKLQAYFRQTTNELVEKTLEANNSEEAERLAKASYVQIRKTATTMKSLLEQEERNHEQSIVATKAQHDEICTLMADSINKATKVVVKYSQNDNDKLVENIETLSAQVAELKLVLDNSGEGTAESGGTDYTAILSDILGKLDTLKINVAQQPAVEIPSPSAMVDEYEAVDEFENENPAVTETDDLQEVAEEVAEDVSPVILDEELEETPEETPDLTVAVEEDPNKQLSADEIAALFAASKEERKAESDDDFKVEDHPEAMDQSLIDALLSLDTSATVEEEPKTAAQDVNKLADVIPFPAAEQAEEAPAAVEAPAPVSEDPNKKLSADEIAALFAAADVKAEQPASEADAETAAQPASEPEAAPEPAASAPAEDPGRQLTPDEIAALFSSMSG